MLLSDIESWSVGALQAIASELAGELTTVESVAADLRVISALPGWNSAAADAARGKIGQTTKKVLDDAAVIGAVQQLAQETAAAVAKMQSELADVRAQVAAQHGYLQLADDGEVTITAPADQMDKVRPIADALEARAKALIHQAEDVDADCAQVFGKLEHGEITANGASDVGAAEQAGRDQSGLSAPYPPEGDPQDVNAWWDALSTEEQQKLIAEHPDWLNRDGVPVPVRSQVNIGVLEREIADAQRDFDAIPHREDFIRSHPEMDAAQAAAVYTQMVSDRTARLTNARAMRDALSIGGSAENGYDPNKYLMSLEFPSGREPQAVIAVGNPDEAEHVTVTTPGMNTHPTSLPTMVNEAAALRAEAENQLDLAGRPGEQVATIAYLGYDPPDTSDISILEALSEDRAKEAAPDLAAFYRGINATNEHGADVHLSAFGHSFGSLTTAAALYELGEAGVVDDAAFYGSPGLGFTDDWRGVWPFEVPAPIDDESDLFLPDGHGFVMATPDDPVAGSWRVAGISLPSLGDLGQHGPNPTSLPLEQLSTGATVTHDGVSRQAAFGHSDYPRPGDGGILRTTGYNLAIIASGLAHDPKYSDWLVR